VRERSSLLGKFRFDPLGRIDNRKGCLMRNDKVFAVPKERMRQLLPPLGGCLASDRITVDGKPVGYMYRETGDDDGDNGWRYFSGDETEAYSGESSNFSTCAVNTMANYDPDIIPHVGTPAPCAFEKISGTNQYRPVDCPDREA
jgi:hypothetical protein